MLTAEQARALSGWGSGDYLNFIEGKIREAAADGRRMVKIREEPMARWLYGNPSDAVSEEVIRTLRDAGYSVDLYYREAQFVDMALMVSWD